MRMKNLLEDCQQGVEQFVADGHRLGRCLIGLLITHQICRLLVKIDTGERIPSILRLFEQRGYRVFPLPTGQGLVFKRG